MDNEQFAELSEKLNVLTKLLAANLLQNKNVTESVLLLSSYGLRPVQIQTVLGKSKGTVSGILSQKRQSKEKAKARPKLKAVAQDMPTKEVG